MLCAAPCARAARQVVKSQANERFRNGKRIAHSTQQHCFVCAISQCPGGLLRLTVIQVLCVAPVFSLLLFSFLFFSSSQHTHTHTPNQYPKIVNMSLLVLLFYFCLFLFSPTEIRDEKIVNKRRQADTHRVRERERPYRVSFLPF